MKSSQCRVGSTAGASRHPMLLGCSVLGKIQIRVSESKHGFCVFWGANPKTDHESIKSTQHSGWILRIKSKSGFLRLAIWTFFWERIWKQYFCQAVFRTKMVHNRCRNKYDILTECIYVAGALTLSHYLHIIPCFLSIYIRRLFWNPYLSCVLDVCSVCLRLFILDISVQAPLERYRASKNWNSADHSVFVKRFRAERRGVKQALLSMPCYLPFFDSKGQAPSLVHISFYTLFFSWNFWTVIGLYFLWTALFGDQALKGADELSIYGFMTRIFVRVIDLTS